MMHDRIFVEECIESCENPEEAKKTLTELTENIKADMHTRSHVQWGEAATCEAIGALFRFLKERNITIDYKGQLFRVSDKVS